MPVMYLDESEHGDFLSVSGYYCSTGDVPRIEASWRRLKQELGLEPTTPLKWSPQGAVHDALAAGIGVDGARRRAADVIRELPIEIVAIVLQERRGTYLVLGMEQGGNEVTVDEATWREIHPEGGSVRHFYLRGVEFALQRFADHVGRIPSDSAEPSRLVLDDLDWARNRGKKTEKLRAKLAQLPAADAWVIRDWIERGLDAAHDAYARWYVSGFGNPYERLGRLGELGFESSFYQCHDARSDAMQVADFAAGCAGAFMSELSRGRVGTARDCLCAIKPRIRATGSIGWEMWGNGFVLWPRNPGLWNKAKGALV